MASFASIQRPLATILLAAVVCAIYGPQIGGATFAEMHSPYTLTDAVMREVVAKMGQDTDDYLKYPSGRRVAKEFEEEPSMPADYEALLDPQEAMIRDQEYLQHSSLWGHQYLAGGAGEGKQHLKPDGSVRNSHQVKTDSVLPAYCDPPNPCPVGQTAEDGCLEQFSNSAAFSREYQASQECMCDTEHMFDCPSSSRPDEINALAQSIQNEGGISEHAINRIMQDLQIHDQHKSLVAKKHYSSQVKDSYLRDLRSRTKKLAIKATSRDADNPYLRGEKLPIVAKKGSNILM